MVAAAATCCRVADVEDGHDGLFNRLLARLFEFHDTAWAEYCWIKRLRKEDGQTTQDTETAERDGRDPPTHNSMMGSRPCVRPILGALCVLCGFFILSQTVW